MFFNPDTKKNPKNICQKNKKVAKSGHTFLKIFFSSLSRHCATPKIQKTPPEYKNQTPKKCFSACAQNQFQCSDGTKCIPKAQFQDGKEDCDDGSDEECTTSQFACQCGTIKCVSDTFIMDGNWDCEDGSDEFINKTLTGEHFENSKGF